MTTKLQLIDIATEAERGRIALATRMMTFAAETLPLICETDLEAGQPVDPADIKSSLLRHPGVSKAVRLAASVAAVAQAFELRNFHRLHYAEYVAECEAEIGRTTNPAQKSRLESNLAAVKYLHEMMPHCRAGLVEYSAIYKRNADHAVNELTNFCHRIASEWLAVVPSENIATFISELEHVAVSELSVKLRWFGLSDFTPV